MNRLRDWWSTSPEKKALDAILDVDSWIWGFALMAGLQTLAVAILPSVGGWIAIALLWYAVIWCGWKDICASAEVREKRKVELAADIRELDAKRIRRG